LNNRQISINGKERKTRLNSKQRLLKLQDILKKYTDEENELSLNQIIELFNQEADMMVGKKAIHDDLLELEKSLLFDVTVNQEKEGVEKYYSHQQRLFEVHELRMLIDAVSSAKFISTAETEKLISKIKKLTSENHSKLLKNTILLSENVKNENQQIKYSIHELHNAIANFQKVTFQYGKYNLQKKFELNRNGEFYFVKPYGLVWGNDFYYLIGTSMSGEIRHYRVDRMRNVTSTKESFVPDSDFNVTKYTEKLYNMYSGEETLTEIEFANHLINVVIDRFGRGIHIRPGMANSFRVSTQAMLSDGLVRWILTWGSDAKVITPPSLVERMKTEAEKFYHIYH
jgi:predicted DNA-binding transcriptional regulator YafY